MPDVDIVVSEWDAAAWYRDGKIYVNVRWVNVEEEVAWYIDESFIHEYVEHVLGLGHEGATYVERVLRRLLYRDWYGVEPTEILYGKRGGVTSLGLRGRVAPTHPHSREKGLRLAQAASKS